MKEKTRKADGPAVLFLKGAAMGSADVVPGVSGGTIAFITGIYETLVDAIRSFDTQALRFLFAKRFRELWAHVNGSFLLALGLGIGTAIISLSRLILYGLDRHPELIWSFFFGLIVASAWAVSRKIESWKPAVWGGFFSGIIMGYLVTVAIPARTPDTSGFVFLSGMIAICAMILPGISGSFILVLLGKYEYVLGALKDLHFQVIFVFCAGAGTGLLAFSHLLHYMLSRFHDMTIAMLTGIMIGSLNKVWPWKHVISTYTNHKGQIKPLVEQNILPASGDPNLVWALLLAVLGSIIVIGLEKTTKVEDI